jgi:hypothetical protein
VTSLARLANPFNRSHSRPYANLRLDREIVHQAARARQAGAKRLHRAIAIAHRQRDIGDAWAAILRYHYHPTPIIFLNYIEMQLARSSMNQDIACQLKYHNLDSGAIDVVEAERGRQLAPSADRHIDIDLTANRAYHRCH